MHERFRVGHGVVGIVLMAAASSVWGWTTPVSLSNAPSGSEPSVPRIAYGPSGCIHAVYQQKPEWRIYYRQRSAAGNWGSIEVLGSDFCAGRADVIEDASGRAHVVFPMRGAGGYYDLMHAIRTGGSWTTTAIMNTGGSGDYEDYPRLARDSAGRIHLVYTHTPDSQPGTVAYRMWNGSSWSSETTLGSISNAYYQRPDVSMDASDRMHVVWAVNGGLRNVVQYRRYAAGSWSTIATIGQSIADGGSNGFIAYPKIAAATASSVMAVWHDSNATSQPVVLVCTGSTNGGVTWAAQQILNAGHYPSMEAGNGLAHLVYEAVPSGTAILYRAWNGSSWGAAQTVTPASSYWKGWPDVTDDAGGTVHVVYDDVVNSGNTHQISYVASAQDFTPPGPVSNFTATPGNATVWLSWRNPSDPDVSGTLVRCKTTGYPTGPTDGTLVCNRPASANSSDGYGHNNLTNGTLYYYAAFTYDVVGNYSTGTTASARPMGLVDADRDGDVDLNDFSAFQTCFNGPNRPPPAVVGCLDRDFDNDGDVDLMDFGVLQTCFNGPNRPPAAGCGL